MEEGMVNVFPSSSSSSTSSSIIAVRMRRGINLSTLTNELRDVDINEQQKQYDFKANSCGCTRLYGKPCSDIIDQKELISYRSHCLETPRSELDLVIKVQLYHRRKVGADTDCRKHKKKEREKTRQEYFFHGHQVCRETFAFAHGVYRKTVDTIGRSVDSAGLIPRTHGNTGKSPKHALTLTDTKNIKIFITSYANTNTLPLPGRLPNFRDCRALLLPSDKTKADIHQYYLNAAEQMQFRTVCVSEFKTIWLEQCPHIFIATPSTDLCHKCQKFVTEISRSGNVTEEEKTARLDLYKVHLDKAKGQRDHYREQCERAKTIFTTLTEEQKQRGKPHCSLSGVQHYSFDYAQQVHYPHYPQQVGPLFFKTPRKCQCFGVCAEGSGSHIFYLVDEAQHSGKGSNTLTSLLHHHFMYRGYGETDVQLHMDNCTGQNKNNTVISYGLWRCMTSRHHSLQFSMMEAGHTKFHPDWHFGLWKVKWRYTTVETMAQVASSVADSSRNNHNIPQLVDDAQCPVVFQDWKTHLKKIFKPVPSLTSYHHFRMDRDHPGTVFLKTYANDKEVAVNLLKPSVDPTVINTMPDVITAPGLDPQRQWYLHDEVAPYCFNTAACPKPQCPKPKNTRIR